MSTCIGFRASRRPAGQPGAEPRTPPKSRTSSTTRLGTLHRFEEIDRTVSRAMADAWVQFAKTGNPNGAALPNGLPTVLPDYRLLDFGERITVRSNAQSPQVDFFQRVFDTMRGKPSTSASAFQQPVSPTVNPAQEPPIRRTAAPVPNCELHGPLIRFHRGPRPTACRYESRRRRTPDILRAPRSSSTAGWLICRSSGRRLFQPARVRRGGV